MSLFLVQIFLWPVGEAELGTADVKEAGKRQRLGDVKVWKKEAREFVVWGRACRGGVCKAEKQ
jgi:hypothetical protein